MDTGKWGRDENNAKSAMAFNLINHGLIPYPDDWETLADLIDSIIFGIKMRPDLVTPTINRFVAVGLRKMATHPNPPTSYQRKTYC